MISTKVHHKIVVKLGHSTVRSERDDQLGLLSESVPFSPLSAIQAELLHPFHPPTRCELALCLFFGNLATILAPELFLALLALLLEANDDVNRTAYVSFLIRNLGQSTRSDSAGSEVGWPWAFHFVVPKERVRGVRQGSRSTSVGTLSQSSNSDTERDVTIGGRATR